MHSHTHDHMPMTADLLRHLRTHYGITITTDQPTLLRAHVGPALVEFRFGGTSARVQAHCNGHVMQGPLPMDSDPADVAHDIHAWIQEHA